jgi:hypothetical protein
MQKKNFGFAAQPAQPRPPATVEPPPGSGAAEDSVAQASDMPVAATSDADDSDAIVADNKPLSERSDHTNHTRRRSVKEKKPGAPPREGGYVRRTIRLGPAVSDYVDRAWRTYRTPNGKYVKGVSGFIEAVIDEHRRRPK